MNFPGFLFRQGTGHFIVDADEKLTACMELESAIQRISGYVR
jgi:hypothetical protein